MPKLYRLAPLPLLWLAVLLACGPATRLAPTAPPTAPATGVTEAVPTQDLVATAVAPLQLTITAIANELATSAAAATAAAVTPIPAPTDLSTAAATATPPALATRAATSPTSLKLSDQGPWLVFSAEDGIWAANSDGSGLTRVMPAKPYFRLGPAAPGGGHAVVVTASDEQGIHNLTLWLLSLPGGDLKQIAALTDASTEPPVGVQPGDAALDLLTPLGQAAWSPDGARLAFIGAQAGPSADLFRYDLASGKLARLTDGPSQAYGPSWSPDGRFIVQMGAQTFGTGAGYTMDGVWAAAADGSSVKLLYKPTSGGEDVLGWAGPETFVVTSFYVSCANGKLRAFDIPTGKVQPIFDGFYSQVAVDPATGVTLAAVDEFVAQCDNSSPQGLYLARPGAAPHLLDADSGIATHLTWSPEGQLFYLSLNGDWVAYTADGQLAPLPDNLFGEPVIAAGGRNWAWVDQDTGQLKASAIDGDAQLVFTGSVLHPTWSPDGRTLLFFADGQLYVAGPDEFTQPRLAGPAQTVKVSDNDRVEWAQ